MADVRENEVITQLLKKWGSDMEEAGLNAADVLQLAGEFQAMIVMGVCASEKDANELLNRMDAASHEYINENWVHVAEAFEMAIRERAHR